MKKNVLIVLIIVLLAACGIAAAEDNSFYPEDMKEYVNAEPAYSILYPAVFTEEMLQETEYGISAVLPDGSASFVVYCQENTENWNNITWMSAKLMENPDEKAETHELNSLVHLTLVSEDSTTMTYCMVTEDWLYIAQLRWNYLHPDFERFCTYMENSFSAEEIGLG